MSARTEPHPAKSTKRAAPKRRARNTTKTCPICGTSLSGKSLSGKSLSGKEQEHRYRPFCSKHCAEIDLGRWLEGRYAIEGPPVDRVESEPEDCG